MAVIAFSGLIIACMSAQCCAFACDYIIYNNETTTLVENTTTHVIDFSGETGELITQVSRNHIGTMCIRPGTYKVSTTISLSPGTKLVGGGNGGSFLETTTANSITKLLWTGEQNGRLIQVGITDSVWFGAIENLYLDGNSRTKEVIVIVSAQGSTFRNLNILNGNMNGYGLWLYSANGDQFSTISLNHFENIFISDMPGFGLVLEGTVKDRHVVTLNTFSNMRISANKISVRFVSQADSNTFIGGRIESSDGGIGVSFNDAYNNDMDIYNNVFYSVPIDLRGDQNKFNGTQIYTGTNKYNMPNIFYSSLLWVGEYGTQEYRLGDSKTLLINCPYASPFNFGTQNIAPLGYGDGDTYFNVTTESPCYRAMGKWFSYNGDVGC